MVEVLATDQSAVVGAESELIAGLESALTGDAAETLDVVDAITRSHHQVDVVKANTAARTLHAE